MISSKRSLIDKKFAPYALDADSQTDFVKIRIFDEYYHCDTMSQHFRDRLYVYVCSRNTSVTLARLGIRQPGAVDRSRRGVRPCRRHRRTLSEQSTRPDIQICTTRDLLITTSSSRLWRARTDRSRWIHGRVHHHASQKERDYCAWLKVPLTPFDEIID